MSEESKVTGDESVATGEVAAETKKVETKEGHRDKEIRFRCEADGKFTLLSNIVDSDGENALAGAKIIINSKAKAKLDPKEGEIFSCTKLKLRAKSKAFYGSGNIKKCEDAPKKEASMYEILSRAPKPEGFIVKDSVWTLLLRNILRGKHTVLVGPTGSGKTELVAHAAETLEYAFNSYNLGNATDPRSKLIGSMNLVMDEGGKCNVTNFVEARFVKDVQSDKNVILLDEINRSNPEVNNMLLTLLDGQGYLELDEHPELPVIYKSETCVLIGTANIGDEYVGTNILDRAFKDRVFMIEIDYLSKDEEKALIIERTNINEESANMIAEFAETCRAMWKRDELGTPISTRMTLETGYMMADGFDFNKSVEATILPHFDNDGTASSDATKIKQAMQKKG